MTGIPNRGHKYQNPFRRGFCAQFRSFLYFFMESILQSRLDRKLTAEVSAALFRAAHTK